MQLKMLMLILLISATANSFAMFCPADFKQINMGDSINTVIQQCGQPTSYKQYKLNQNPPQEWTYYINPAQVTAFNANSNGTIKLTIAFEKNAAVNISVNGLSLNTTNVCGPLIHIGSSPETIKNACGNPAFTNQSEDAGGYDKQITELIYTNPTHVTLIFEDNKLKERK